MMAELHLLKLHLVDEAWGNNLLLDVIIPQLCCKENTTTRLYFNIFTV